jgi:hypothetical protein
VGRCAFAVFTPSLSAAQTTPQLKRVGIIRTTPFVHTRISMRDGEGSAYVPRDHSLWLADDSTDAIFEVASKTGNIPGWSFDLTPFGVRDSRAVERIGGRFFVLDGAPRRGDDRLEYAVFEFGVER